MGEFTDVLTGLLDTGAWEHVDVQRTMPIEEMQVGVLLFLCRWLTLCYRSGMVSLMHG